jgi:hypothetical protein
MSEIRGQRSDICSATQQTMEARHGLHGYDEVIALLKIGEGRINLAKAMAFARLNRRIRAND